MSTNLPSAVDTRRTIDANFRFTTAYASSLEDQIVALSREIARVRNQPYANVYVQADPDGSTMAPGTAVAVKSGARTIIVPATYGNVVVSGGVLLGVLTEQAAPGSTVNVATAGFLPNTISGLGALTGKCIRANYTTGVLEAVTAFGPSDIAIGQGRADGGVVLQITPLGLGGGGVRLVSFEVDYTDLSGLGGGQKTYEFNPLYPANAITSKARVVGYSVTSTGFVGFDDGAAGTFTVSLAALATADIMGDVNVTVGETGFPKAGSPGVFGFPAAQPGAANLFATLTGTNDLNTATAGHLTAEVLIEIVGS